MGKLSYDEKLRIQMLREQGLHAKAIVSSYPDKGWKLSTVNKSAVEWTTLAQPFCINQEVEDLPQPSPIRMLNVSMKWFAHRKATMVHTSTLSRSLQTSTSVSRLSVILLKEVCISRASVAYPHRSLMMRHVRRGWNVQELFWIVSLFVKRRRSSSPMRRTFI